MMRSLRVGTVVRTLATQLLDGLEERIVGMLPPAASDMCLAARRGK